MPKRQDLHVHVFVSARDNGQKTYLSPNINNKKRFSKLRFYYNSDHTSDNIFYYQRIESKLQPDQIRKYGSLETL